MSSIDTAKATGADLAPGEQDLGPLAWVLDELRKSLEGAVKAMRRFVRDAEIARESDLASLDAGPLRIARQQLHQAGGALDMVGMEPPALVVRALESAVQRFVQRPELCSDDASGVIERASFALVEYLEHVLAGKAVSPVALFPQYQQAQALAGVDRVHPADLWPAQRRFREPELTIAHAPLPYGPEARARLDRAVLRIVKSADPAAAHDMQETCLGFAAAQANRQVRAFWKICAGFFEALSQQWLQPDVYAKRVASRVLLQYAALAKGETDIADRLVQDLLFFCAQATPVAGGAADEASALQAVRRAFGLEQHQPVDYAQPRFGLFDPAMLAQARKRIAAATETWSALAGGDRNKFKQAADQFSLVCDSLRKLHPDSESLAQALTRAVEATTRSAEIPAPALAMEVATSVLYLQASFEELDVARQHMAQRATRLAERLDGVVAGGDPQPLEPWMEELYRRVSDHQTMGSVVGELRATLAEAEKSMDQFFRDPQDLAALGSVPSSLQQMRGVLSVLGLDQASHAVVRMRDMVERLLTDDVPQEQRQQVFDKLGNSLGALGFLIDMLSYQRNMARKLFVYDEEQGELRALMGRVSTPAPEEDEPHDALPASAPVFEQTQALTALEPALAPAEEPVAEPLPVLADLDFSLVTQPVEPEQAAPAKEVAAPQAEHAAPAAPAAMGVVDDVDDGTDELLDIFLEEAREVVGNGLAAIEALHGDAADLSEQTTLRRAFHTLKGSSRMVGLDEFGEAAWSMEQVLNAWLAEQKPIHPPLLELADEALQAFGRWADDIAAGNAGHWQAQAFRASADAMRVDGKLLPLASAVAADASQPQAPDAAPELAQPHELKADVPAHIPELPAIDPASTPLPQVAAAVAQEHEFDLILPDIDETGPHDFADTAVNQEQTHAATGAGEVVAESEPVQEIDFAEFEQALEAQASVLPAETMAQGGVPAEEALATEPLGEVPPEASAVIDLPQAAAAHAEVAPVAEDPHEAQAISDEDVKVIEHLRIGIPLYNVYLNEADEWSRRLVTLLQEWALELHQPLPDAAVALAHSLAGSSATVGFQALSNLARMLEHTLQHVQLLPAGLPEHGQTFNAAAQDVRRLLHQFAAGFLKEPGPQVLEQLDQILQTEVISSRTPLDDDLAAEPGKQVDVLERSWPADVVEPAEAAPVEPPAAADTAQPEAVEEATAAMVPPAVPVGALPPQAAYAAAAPSSATPSAIASSDVDDEIDVLDTIDPDLFPIFEEEALELLPALGSALRQWSQRPGNLGARGELLRALHTLKGSARLAGAMRLGEMAHRLESAVEQIDAETATTAEIEPLLSRLDGMQADFDGLRILGAQPLAEPLTVAPEQEAASQATAADGPQTKVSEAPHLAATDAKAARVPVPVPAVAAAPVAVRAVGGQPVRVRAQLLDRLVNQAGEVMIARSRLDVRMTQLRGSLGDLSGNLERLRQQLRDIEVQAESQMQSRLALSKDSAAGFDPLEFDRFTRVQELTRMMAESVNDVATVQRNMQRAMENAEDDLIAQGRQARELQRDLLRTRMVEFEGISERLYAVVRQASKETGKQIKLDISGGSIEMDRGVLDRMTPAFEHLLRNCVAHGIEDAATRSAAGKPATGSIGIVLRHEGNDVSVEFRDDGAGLNLPRIRAKALAQGVLAQGQEISDAEAANLIFMPGFSTASEVTGLAGRGIGMDVVRAEVNALGGRIETETEIGRGAAFRLVLPLTTAVTQVVMIRAGHLVVGLPANLIEIVRRCSSADLDAAYTAHRFTHNGEALDFFWAGALLQSSARSGEAASKSRPVVVVRSAAQRIAMHVDEVLGNQEVVVKNLGPQLVRLPGLAGMSVLASGAVVLIYNPVALAAVYGEQVRGITAAPAPVAQAAAPDAAAAGAAGSSAPTVAALNTAPQVPLVLVVDDSITVRRVTQRLLQREGYRVALAADGLQALERLQEERPVVVLSDIEMPRMDGFDLARNIRADAALKELPIIMITSRIAEKHREHAMELGVNHYLGKPYSDEELLSLVKHYAQREAAALQGA